MRYTQNVTIVVALYRHHGPSPTASFLGQPNGGDIIVKSPTALCLSKHVKLKDHVSWLSCVVAFPSMQPFSQDPELSALGAQYVCILLTRRRLYTIWTFSACDTSPSVTRDLQAITEALYTVIQGSS